MFLGRVYVVRSFEPEQDTSVLGMGVGDMGSPQFDAVCDAICAAYQDDWHRFVEPSLPALCDHRKCDCIVAAHLSDSGALSGLAELEKGRGAGVADGGCWSGGLFCGGESTAVDYAFSGGNLYSAVPPCTEIPPVV